MAEGGVRTDNEGQLSGSECVFDFYCELCSDDGLNNEAHGYCVDCEEYLCDFCIRVHKKSRQTRRHDLLDQDSMPKDTPLPQDRISKDIITKCETHRSKTVEFYCASHDALGCSTCFATLHKACAEIEAIHDKSESILDSEDHKDFISGLKNMVRRSRDMITKTNENVGKTERCCADAIRKIKEIREEFNIIFDELEQTLIAQVDFIASEDKQTMGHLKEELETISDGVETIRSKCEDLANAKRVCQLYIEMKKRKGELASLGEKLTKAEGNSNARMLVLQPSNDLRESIRSNGLGKIAVSNAHNGETSSGIDGGVRLNIADIKAVHVADIDLRTSTDVESYYIIGSAVMSGTRVIIADFNNRKIKLLGIGTKKFYSELQLSGYLFHIAIINESLAAISICFEKKIIFVKIRNTISIDREMPVQGQCRGVAYSQNRLLVTFEDNPRLEILDLQGNVVKSVDRDGCGGKIFSYPRHVCVSNNGDTIYVSDIGAKKVFCLMFDGAVKSVFTELSDPQKVCVDNYGHFLVAGSNEKTVHMVTRDCKKSKVILTQTDGLNERLLSVSLCQHTHRLYVGMDGRSGSSTLRVYQLS